VNLETLESLVSQEDRLIPVRQYRLKTAKPVCEMFTVSIIFRVMKAIST